MSKLKFSVFVSLTPAAKERDERHLLSALFPSNPRSTVKPQSQFFVARACLHTTSVHNPSSKPQPQSKHLVHCKENNNWEEKTKRRTKIPKCLPHKQSKQPVASNSSWGRAIQPWALGLSPFSPFPPHPFNPTHSPVALSSRAQQQR